MFRFAIGNLLSRPVRSALSVLGLTVAISGMVGLFSIAGGIDNLVRSTFELIPGLLVQQRGAPVPIFSVLPSSWQSELEEIDGVSVVNPEVLARVNVIDGKTIISPPRFLLGFDIESRLRLRRGVYCEQIEKGRFLEPDDRGSFNIVVSRQIAEEFEKGVNDTLRVNGYDMRIVGVYHSGSLLLDVNVLADIETVRRMARFDPDSVSCFYLETEDDVDQEVLQQRIEQQFADRSLQSWQPSLLGLMQPGSANENPIGALFRQLDVAVRGRPESTDPEDASAEPSDATAASAPPSPTSGSPPPESPIEVRTGDDWSDRFSEMTGDLDLFLGIMTAIGVSIAVLSIINTMLMSVTERTIEFGILRANGWTSGEIVRLITFESGLLGIFGGLFGAIIGWSATLLLNANWPDRLHLYAGPGLLLFGVAFSTLLGVMGGVYPAWLAARLSPMEAIRRG
ncbi:ABC transporter permease YtrF precursor [Maioricimonas rarisocia]|uniref:ABC transporter permease YtrF n=1 Tax=Maioricimonas rarisocia TaxID=2528026 RepID=A0A517Z0C0_9PLAN|nr:ABC transporter permease [Maioricimonas rarisocia]QDU35927.1 ABC transporter permease YtrF precursor [Maioricimonas rarisocia]